MTIRSANSFGTRSYQRGTALAVALIFLLLMTIIGVSAMSTATLEEKMAGNTKDRNIAFQAAESALRDGERHAQNNVTAATVFTTFCNNGLCLPALASATTVNPQVWTATAGIVDWNAGTNSVKYGDITTDDDIVGVSVQPRYIIEDIPDPTSGGGTGKPGDSLSCRWEPKGCPTSLSNFFRITAWGRGPAGAEVMVQSIFEK